MNDDLTDFELRILAECAFLVPRLSRGPMVFAACDLLRKLDLITDEAEPTKAGLEVLVARYHDLPAVREAGVDPGPRDMAWPGERGDV